VILDERVIGGLDDVEGFSMVYEILSLYPLSKYNI